MTDSAGPGCPDPEGCIKLGFPIITNFGGQLGTVNVAFGDGERQAQAVIDDINAGGGIAGRTVIKDVFPLDSSNPDQAGVYQRACLHFAEDAKVFAIVGVGLDRSGNLCLAKRHVHILNSFTGVSEEAFVRGIAAPWMWGPTSKSEERGWKNAILALVRQDFFKFRKTSNDPPALVPESSPTVGLLTQREAPSPAVAERVKGMLDEQAGIPDSRVFTFEAKNVQDSTEMGVAAQYFASKGVTHVFFFGPVLYFEPDKVDGDPSTPGHQPFRPRLGLKGAYVPAVIAEAFAVNDANFRNLLIHAIGISWNPFLDNTPGNRTRDQQEHPEAYESLRRGESRCNAAMAKYGQKTDDLSTAKVYCDATFAFEAGAKAAGRNLTAGNFVAGMRSITRYDSPTTFLSNFSRGPDASFAHRLLRFTVQQTGTCPCRYEYYSPLLPDAP